MSPYLIPTDPAITCIERTGRPSWEISSRHMWNAFGGYPCEDDEEWEEDDGDVFYGNETPDF